MQNLSPTDKFLVQRQNNQHYALASDITQYQSEQIDGQLEIFAQQIADEEAARIQGDNNLDNKIDNLTTKIEIGVEALFPSEWTEDYDFSVQDAVPVINFKIDYDACVATGGDVDTCYQTHLTHLQESIKNLGNDHDHVFTGEFENTTITNFKQLRTLIVGEKSKSGNTVDWDELKQNDLLEVSRVTSTDERDREVYAIYQVVKNWTIPIELDREPGQPHLIQLEYIGGTQEFNFFSGTKYRMRYLADFKTDITDTFVKTAGDVMTGELEMTSSAIKFSDGTVGPAASHLVRDTGDLVIAMETADVTITNEGLLTGIKTSDGNEISDAVNVELLNNELTIVNNDTDVLENKIELIDQKIDAIALIRDSLDYTSIFLDDCESEADLADWNVCAAPKVTKGLFAFHSKTFQGVPIGTALNGETFTNRICMSATTADDGSNTFLQNLANNDILEFIAIGDNVQSVIYRVVTAFVDVGVTYIDVNTEFFFGQDGFLDNTLFKVKHFTPSESISANEINQIYAKIAGQGFTGPISINDVTAAAHSFEIKSNLSANKSQFSNNAEIFLYSVTSSAKLEIKNPNTNTITLNENGLDSTNKYSLSLNGSKKIEIGSASVDFNNNTIVKVTTDGNNDTSVVNVEYLKAYTDIFALKDTAADATRISTAPDFTGVINDNDVLRFDGNLQKWTASPISADYRGKNVFATSESETEVGGMWTDGSNYYIRTA